MTKRQTLLEHIRIEFAENGETTKKAMRIYCENRISRQAYDLAAQTGMKQFNSLKKG